MRRCWVFSIFTLRDRTKCITVMGKQSGVDVVSMRVTEGDTVDVEGMALDAIYTPGHTDDSYCFLFGDQVFTGGMLHELAKASDKRMIFYCAFGERSAMAVHAARDGGMGSICNLTGGIDAWKKAGGQLE